MSTFPFSILVTFDIVNGVNWIKVNAGQNGYFRVLYDEKNWENIVRQLKTQHDKFTAPVSLIKISTDTNLNNSNSFPFHRIVLDWFRMHLHCVTLI